MAFLQVVTRTFGRRPSALARNQGSLADLSDPDWAQTLVMDEAGRGVNWANMNLATVPAVGDYLWMLDDDDVCVLPSLVGDLKRIVDDGRPDVIMVRAEHARLGLLPGRNWRLAPVLRDVSTSNFIVRADVWNAYRAVFAGFDCYEADYRFVAYLWQQGLNFYWHDVVAVYYAQNSLGAPE